MRARRRSRAVRGACLTLALVLALGGPATARTQRDRKRTSAPVVLKPFLHLRSAVHSVADPIAFQLPRIVASASTRSLPSRSSGKPRRLRYIARAEIVDEDQLDVDEDEVPVRRNITIARRVLPNGPIRLAYLARQSPQPSPPPAPTAEDEEQDQEEGPSVNETRPARSIASKPMVRGNRAVLRNGVAYAPAQAPQSVKNAIWAANTLRGKPYFWGGGHGSFNDRGYDCSGTVSFALHHAGALAGPLPSSAFLHYGESGRGRWITIYSRSGHTFATIAGLRLDTTDFENGGNTGPRWHTDGRDSGGYVARHPAGM